MGDGGVAFKQQENASIPPPCPPSPWASLRTLKDKEKTQVLICFPSKPVQCLTRRGYKMGNERMQVLRIRVTGSDVEGILRRNVELSVHVRK